MKTEKEMLDKKLEDALREFKKSYLNLVDTLHETTGSNKEGEGHRFDSIAGIHYPLDVSFDELDITEWVDQSIKNLKEDDES